jgi:excisionase family DNA binding protein
VGDILTIPEFAALSRRSLSTCYKWVERGVIASYRPSGGKVHLLQSDVEAFLSRGRRASSAERAVQADAALNGQA